MKLTYVLIGLDKDLLKKVAKESRLLKHSRSKLVRKALEEYFIRAEMEEAYKNEIKVRQTRA